MFTYIYQTWLPFKITEWKQFSLSIKYCIFLVFAWVACFIAFLCMINFDAHFEEYQSDICYTMVVVNGAVFLIAIAPMRAVRRYARGIPVPFLNVQNIVNRDNEDDVTRVGRKSICNIKIIDI